MDIDMTSPRQGNAENVAYLPHPREILNHEGGAALQEAINKVPEHYWTLSDEELEKLFRPSKTIIRLRRALVGEIYFFLFGHGSFSLKRLADRAGCSYARAHQLLVGTPAVLAWVARPIVDTKAECLELKFELIDSIMSILKKPHEDMYGNFDYRLAEMKIRIHELLQPIRKYPPMEQNPK